MNLRKMIVALVLAVLGSTLVYTVLVILSDGPAVAEALTGFSPVALAAMLLLGLGCYVVRALRWGWLLRLLGHPVSVRDALYLHLAGQTMTISPGRVGEVLKPWLSREVSGLPMSRGIALVFTERVADLIAVCLLSLGGLSLVGGSWWTAAAVFAAVLAGTAVVSSAWFHRLALGVIERQRRAEKHRDSAVAISETVRTALSWRVLALSSAASVLAWGLEGVGFVVCVHELGFGELGFAAAVSVYAVATIIGAFTFLPGGIGLTEASMAGILVFVGMDAAGASAATLLTRVATLWWAVVLGWAVLASRPALLKRLFRGQVAE